MKIYHDEYTKIFKAFCDENRLRILEMLRSGEKCGCMLEEALPISQSTLSHHMKILVESGVVAVRKDKKWSYYTISDDGAEQAKALLQKILEKEYDQLVCCNCDME